MAVYCDGIRLIKLDGNKSTNRIEKEIFFKNNPGCRIFDDNDSDSSSIVSFRCGTNDRPLLQKTVIPKNRKIPVKSKPFSAKTVLPDQKKTKKGTSLNLQTLWANGGPIKLLKYQCDEAQGNLFFKNYENLDSQGISDLISNSGCSVLSVKEVGENLIKVRLKTEEDTRKLHSFLKKDDEYDVIVLLDMEDYQVSKRKEFHLKRLSKLKGDKFTLSEDMPEGGILSNADKANELEAQIRFNFRSPSSRCTKKMSDSGRTGQAVYKLCTSPVLYKQHFVETDSYEHTAFSSSSFSSSDEGVCIPPNLISVPEHSLSHDEVPEILQIGSWNGHVVIKPAIPAPNLSERPLHLKNTQHQKEPDFGTKFNRQVGRKPLLKKSLDENSNLLMDMSAASSRLNSKEKSEFHRKYESTSSSNEAYQKEKPFQKRLNNRRVFQNAECVCLSNASSSDYQSSLSSKSFEVRSQQLQEVEEDSPQLISIFDIFTQVMKKNILNNLETSFEVVKR